MGKMRASQQIGQELIGLWKTGRQVESLSRRFPIFALGDTMPAKAGDIWHARFQGIAFDPPRLRII